MHYILRISWRDQGQATYRPTSEEINHREHTKVSGQAKAVLYIVKSEQCNKWQAFNNYKARRGQRGRLRIIDLKGIAYTKFLKLKRHFVRQLLLFLKLSALPGQTGDKFWVSVC